MIRIREFINIFAKRNNLTKENAEIVCKAVFETLGDVIYEDGEDVCINKLGTFRHKVYSARPMKLPTGESIEVPERTIIKFTQTAKQKKSNEQ